MRRKPKALLPAEQVFVTELTTNGGNASAAFRVACPDYPGVPKSIGPAARRFALRKSVAYALSQLEDTRKAALQAVIDRYAITQERVHEEMARLAFARMDDVAAVVTETLDTGKVVQRVKVRDFMDIHPEALKAIASLRTTQTGAIAVEIYDKRGALMDLARLKGWIADRPQIDKPPIPFNVIRGRKAGSDAA